MQNFRNKLLDYKSIEDIAEAKRERERERWKIEKNFRNSNKLMALFIGITEHTYHLSKFIKYK